MDLLNEWIAKQSRRSERFISVHEALLGANPFSYLLYRLRYFSVLTLVGLVAHLIEFALLFYFLKRHNFISIITFKIIFTLLNGAWWGSLEIMRERIRRYYQAKKTKEIGVEITLWMIIGFGLNIIVILATLPLSGRALVHLFQGQITLFDTYIVVIIFQALCMVFVRTLHSGCLAIRRVYRPLTSIIIYEVSTVFFILIFLPFLHAYSLPVGVGISSILNIIISLYYDLNMYRFLRIQPFRLPRLNHLIWRLRQLFSTELLSAALSSLIMQIENVIVLVLLFRSQYYDHLGHISILIYLVSPLIRASFDWIKLFYYDLKKYAGPLYANMLKILNRYIEYASFVIVVIFWLISILLAFVFKLFNVPILLTLFPLYLLRSYLAHWQMHRFTEMRFLDVINSGLIVVAGILIALAFHLNIYYLLVTIIGFMAIALVYLIFFQTRVIETDSYHPPEIPFYLWLLGLKEDDYALCAYNLTFSKTKSAERSKNFIYYFHDKINRRPKFTRLDEANVLLYEPIIYKVTAKRAHFYNTLSAGNIIQDYSTGLCANGIIAFDKLMQDHIITSNSLQFNSQQLVELFRQQFPNATCIDLTQNNTALLQKFSKEELDNIFYQLMHFLRWPLKALASDHHYVLGGIEESHLRYVYIIPRTQYPKNIITEWQYTIHNCNVTQINEETR